MGLRSTGEALTCTVGVITCVVGVGSETVVAIGGGVAATPPRPNENLGARVEMNDPIPDPHDAKVGLAAGVVGVEIDVGVAGKSTEACLFSMNGRGPLGTGGGVFASTPSKSAFDTSTGVLERESLGSDSTSDGVEDAAVRCDHLSRTPSTALKKLVEPTDIVRATASRAGASCCSSFSS